MARLPKFWAAAAAASVIAGAPVGAEQRAEPLSAEPASAAPACAGLDRLSGGARWMDCRLALELLWGPDDPRLLAFYASAAADLSDGQDGAVGALPYARRGFELAGRLETAFELSDDDRRHAGEASLAYGRALILSGRCTAIDSRVREPVAAAARLFSGMTQDDPRRAAGLRDAAFAQADSLQFAAAERTLRQASAAMSADDWERIGRWRRLDGDAAGAAEAYEAALGAPQEAFAGRAAQASAQTSAQATARRQAALRRLYFELGDLGAAQRVGSPD